MLKRLFGNYPATTVYLMFVTTLTLLLQIWETFK